MVILLRFTGSAERLITNGARLIVQAVIHRLRSNRC